MGLDPGGLVAVRNFAPVEPFLIASIQPVGSGTEVHLVDGQPMTVGAVPPQQGALTSGGVPWELVRRFLGQRGHVQPAKAHKDPLLPIVVSNPVRPVCIGDVHLNYYQVWLIIGLQFFNVLILQINVIIIAAIGGKCCQTQWRKK